MTASRRTLTTAGLLLAALVLAFLVAQFGSDDTGGGADQNVVGQTDPESGLTWVDVAELPSQAAATLTLIDRGGPFPYPANDGGTFGNREGLLPDHERGYYREYTVPTPGSGSRGARRIITGDDDERFWTADHYDSFQRIRP